MHDGTQGITKQAQKNTWVPRSLTNNMRTEGITDRLRVRGEGAHFLLNRLSFVEKQHYKLSIRSIQA